MFLDYIAKVFNIETLFNQNHSSKILKNRVILFNCTDPAYKIYIIFTENSLYLQRYIVGTADLVVSANHSQIFRLIKNKLLKRPINMVGIEIMGEVTLAEALRQWIEQVINQYHTHYRAIFKII